jgi:hypothetical protein
MTNAPFKHFILITFTYIKSAGCQTKNDVLQESKKYLFPTYFAPSNIQHGIAWQIIGHLAFRK